MDDIVVTSPDRAENTEVAEKAAAYRRLARDGLAVVDRVHGIRRYQPLYGLTDEDRALFPAPKRLVDERWEHIGANLPPVGSAMDVGCQHGWFTFKLAERGLHTIGVEGSLRAFQVAQWLTLYNQSDRASFQRLYVDAETAQHLPAVDVVVCMAIFHHWVRLQGLDDATRIMQALADRCRDRMFFETGQVGDTDTLDRSSIGFMGRRPRRWIKRFLKDLGFRKVVHLATLSRSTDNRRTRHLMLALR